MSTTLRVSETTKRKLERIKQADESFDELLGRLADVEAMMQASAGSWEGTEKTDKALEERDRMKDSFRSG
ncbi:antitoxin VapB family protein [Halobellus ordinarius]|uniref:antitoxin VapB family protein n=1 Tax=Halobellus ordinarius TaxID=3075120 RepID=UPI0028809E50|nr:antitoxin VapB family protein [Halobellus sp. ZY16]